MKRVMTAAVLIPAVLLLIYRAPGWAVAAAAGVVALLATEEYMRLLASAQEKPFRWPMLGLTGTLFLLLALWRSTGETALMGMAATVLVFGVFGLPPALLCLGLLREDQATALRGAALTYFALPYILAPMVCLVLLHQAAGGADLLLFLFTVVWAGDILAYYVGKNLGRHRMAPRISPKKTWEGAAASVAGSIAAGYLVMRYLGPIGAMLGGGGSGGTGDAGPAPGLTDMGFVLALAAGLNVAAQLGDLAESLIKRSAGAKDSGTLMPGHGGVLDRIDALLFAAPVALAAHFMARL
jgi:phosphatidate cytidylyltransferase